MLELYVIVLNNDVHQSNKDAKKAVFEQSIGDDEYAQEVLDDLEDQCIIDTILDMEGRLKQLNLIEVEHDYLKCNTVSVDVITALPPPDPNLGPGSIISYPVIMGVVIRKL